MLSELHDLSERWFQAWLEKDAETVERLMAEDYLYIAPNGLVLDRERMKLEDVAEDLEVARVRLVQVKPEELPRGQQPLDRFAAEVNLPASLLVDHMADRRTSALGGLRIGRAAFGSVPRGRLRPGRTIARPARPGTRPSCTKPTSRA